MLIFILGDTGSPKSTPVLSPNISSIRSNTDEWFISHFPIIKLVRISTLLASEDSTVATPDSSNITELPTNTTNPTDTDYTSDKGVTTRAKLTLQQTSKAISRIMNESIKKKRRVRFSKEKIDLLLAKNPSSSDTETSVTLETPPSSPGITQHEVSRRMERNPPVENMIISPVPDLVPHQLMTDDDVQMNAVEPINLIQILREPTTDSNWYSAISKIILSPPGENRATAPTSTVSVLASTTPTTTGENRGQASISYQIRLPPVREERRDTPIPTPSANRPPPQPASSMLLNLLQKPATMVNMVAKYPDPPSYAARICILLNLLNTPVVLLDLTAVELDIPDNWTSILKQIMLRMRSNETITTMDYGFYRSHMGFFYYDLLKFMYKHRRMLAAYAPQFVPEIAMCIDGSTNNLPYFCVTCKVGHNVAGPCANPYANGPRFPKALAACQAWKRYTRGIIIGCKSLYYQPPSMTDSYINLSIESGTSYDVGLNGDMLEGGFEPIGNLFGILLALLRMIGLDSPCPVYVEFHHSHRHHMTKRASHHLCGFLKVLKELQHYYFGPVIAIMGPVFPAPGQSLVKYGQQKKEEHRIHQLALALGLTFGVPVGVMEVQSLEANRGPNAYKGNNWSDESLFSVQGVPTREMSNRIHTWFDTTSSAVVPYATSKAITQPPMAPSTPLVHDR